MNKEELKEEIQRMSDIYEVSELSEESGLQDEFEKDCNKLVKEGRTQTLEKVKEKIEELDWVEIDGERFINEKELLSQLEDEVTRGTRPDEVLRTSDEVKK